MTKNDCLGLCLKMTIIQNVGQLIRFWQFNKPFQNYLLSFKKEWSYLYVIYCLISNPKISKHSAFIYSFFACICLVLIPVISWNLVTPILISCTFLRTVVVSLTGLLFLWRLCGRAIHWTSRYQVQIALWRCWKLHCKILQSSQHYSWISRSWLFRKHLFVPVAMFCCVHLRHRW